MAPPTKKNVRGTNRRAAVEDTEVTLDLQPLLMRVMFYAVVLSSTAAAATAWRLGVLRFTCGGLMSVEKVLILGNKQASDAEIRKFGRLTEGMDLMAVDPDAVSAAVRDHPWIRSASIYRSWVDATVTVRVAEYDIAGVIDLGRSIYVDPDGTPFKIAPPEALNDYTLIGGFIPEDFVKKEGGKADVKAALKVIQDWRGHEMSKKADLHKVVKHFGGWELEIGAASTRVFLGTGDLVKKFSRLDRVWSELQRNGKSAVSIHLGNRQHPERISVKFADGSLEGVRSEGQDGEEDG